MLYDIRHFKSLFQIIMKNCFAKFGMNKMSTPDESKLSYFAVFLVSSDGDWYCKYNWCFECTLLQNAYIHCSAYSHAKPLRCEWQPPWNLRKSQNIHSSTLLKIIKCITRKVQLPLTQPRHVWNLPQFTICIKKNKKKHVCKNGLFVVFREFGNCIVKPIFQRTRRSVYLYCLISPNNVTQNCTCVDMPITTFWVFPQVKNCFQVLNWAHKCTIRTFTNAIHLRVTLHG